MTEPGHPIVIDSTVLATDFSAEFWPPGSLSFGSGVRLPKARIIATESGQLSATTARPGLTFVDVILRHIDTGITFGLYDNWLTVLGEDKISTNIPVDNRWEVYVRSQNYSADITIRSSVFLEEEGI